MYIYFLQRTEIIDLIDLADVFIELSGQPFTRFNSKIKEIIVQTNFYLYKRLLSESAPIDSYTQRERERETNQFLFCICLRPLPHSSLYRQVFA